MILASPFDDNHTVVFASVGFGGTKELEKSRLIRAYSTRKNQQERSIEMAMPVHLLVRTRFHMFGDKLDKQILHFFI